MSSQHQPQRTCIGCRESTDQDQLLRWVVEGNGLLAVPDPTRRKSGRGAWLHPTPECAARAVKRRAFSRAFRAPVDDSQVESAVAALGAPPPGGSTGSTVKRESGSEI
ncbi:YlxR family protein [Arthrobacter sp. JSM 101049]|uniref:YlxR family protein n=1 Tax=Arthrobacter sp. JSM 101049 TaxID=929097 RepID=UPI003567D88E